jgi:hypothetical protein
VVEERRQRIAGEIAARLGEPGGRARDFLETADMLVGQVGTSMPKGAELASYALREALTSITAGIRVSGRRCGRIARDVVVAADALNIAQADDPLAMAGLLDAVDGLREFIAAPAVHEAEMIRLIETDWAGAAASRSDPVTEYRALVDAAADALHSSADDVRALLERAFDLLGRLFAPADVALEELDRFVVLENPTANDLAELSGRLVSVAHLRYFTERAKRETLARPALGPTSRLARSAIPGLAGRRPRPAASRRRSRRSGGMACDRRRGAPPTRLIQCVPLRAGSGGNRPGRYESAGQPA